MGKYATRKILKRLCSCAGISLYKHRLDGVSYQYCAGGYVVNGYDTGGKLHDLIYEMQKSLILLLKYGHIDNPCNDVMITFHKEKNVIAPLSEPLDGFGGKVYTFESLESDACTQKYFDHVRLRDCCSN